ncbi:MAG: hypothetical protein R3316_01240 [Rhodovibrionaceae bacterium]|nr:hypothetical protein [Rhodovibrionaceae bacterium]
MFYKYVWMVAGTLVLAFAGGVSAQEIGSGAPDVEWQGNLNLFGSDSGESSETAVGDALSSAKPAADGLGESKSAYADVPLAAVGETNAAKAAPDGQEEYSDAARLKQPIKVATSGAPKTPNVQFSAVVAPGAEPIGDGVSYRIWRKKNGRFFLAMKDVGTDDKVSLAPGSYRLEATYDRAVKVEDFQVTGTDLKTHVVDLNAGWATLRLISHLNGKPLKGPTEWDLYTYGRDKSGKRVKIASSKQTQPAYVLSAGHYYVEARHGDAEVNHVVEITAGHRYTYTLNLNAGTMRTYAELAKGVDPSIPIVWEVYPADEPGNTAPLARNVSPEADFVLNEGRYVVVASQGEVVSRREIRVRAGQSQDLRVKLAQ